MTNKTNKVERLPLTDDYIFKRVFAFEGNESVLKYFLEAILKKDIEKVEIKNPEIIPYEKEEQIASKYIEFHYIELPKYKKKEPSKFTKLDQWMCIFTENKEGIEMAEKENKEVKRAIDTLDFISEDPKERERHNSIVMAEYNRLTSEHNFFEAGKKERNPKRKI